MAEGKHRLMIIIDSSRSEIDKHAKDTVRHLRKQQFQRGYDPVPMDVAVHIALVPVRCDDCGATFWARDQYAAHLDCRKPSKGMGFGQS